jgi:hypothetical protein
VRPTGSGFPVTYAVPPERGHLGAAVATHIDRWHYVCEIAIPAGELGSRPLYSGQGLTVSLDIQNRGDFERMRVEELRIVLTA